MHIECNEKVQPHIYCTDEIKVFPPPKNRLLPCKFIVDLLHRASGDSNSCRIQIFVSRNVCWQYLWPDLTESEALFESGCISSIWNWTDNYTPKIWFFFKVQNIQQTRFCSKIALRVKRIKTLVPKEDISYSNWYNIWNEKNKVSSCDSCNSCWR